nr:hypothetical protein [Desulfuromonadales bacterium]
MAPLFDEASQLFILFPQPPNLVAGIGEMTIEFFARLPPAQLLLCELLIGRLQFLRAGLGLGFGDFLAAIGKALQPRFQLLGTR